MRPYLHEFLTSSYEYYDIVIWSATNMKWIIEKMKLLGVDKHPSYKIAFYLDSLAMISVHTPKYGVIDVSILNFKNIFRNSCLEKNKYASSYQGFNIVGPAEFFFCLSKICILIRFNLSYGNYTEILIKRAFTKENHGFNVFFNTPL